MKKALYLTLTLLSFVTLVFVPNSFTQEAQPENVVRVIYFLPKDRQPQQDIDTQLDLLMKDVQQSYAEVMENHGFGRKTFPLETDNDGKVVVHHVTGLFPDVYYHTEASAKVEKEVRLRFDLTTNVYFIVLDVSTEDIDGAYCGQASAHGSFGGMSLIPASGECFNVAVAAHELGHTFGLDHDRLRNANRVSSSYHSDWMVTSFCAAEWLDVHSYFNAGENVSNENTQIQMLSSVVSPSNSIRIRFQITDADRLHQAQVMLNGNVITCQGLKGQSDRYEFEWIPRLYGISDNLILRVIDVHGNFTDQHYPINTAILRPPKVVSIPDTNLATAIRETLNLAPSDAFTERNLLKLINLDAEDRQITDLTGLEHATQLQNLNLEGNQISDISPLASLEILESLNLWGNQISDISVLTGLENLTGLNLSSNQISDLNGLTDLPVLSNLDLGSNQIRDITPLAGLTQLRDLSLWFNHIPDISPLAELTGLTRLKLENNVISDVSPLAGLINLESLALDDNLISDISPLDGLAENISISWGNNPGFPIGGPKITGPWLWVIIPETRLDDGTDFLARASGGETTELEIATNGAKEGMDVGDSVWTPHKLSDSSGDNINDMIAALGWGTGKEIYDRIVYGSIVLDSPRKQNTKMFVGSDDAVKVWLNGKLVHLSLLDRGAADYQAFFPVTLEQGKNVLLVAVDNRGWGASSGFFGFGSGTTYNLLVTPVVHVRTVPTKLAEDVNKDGAVNIQDLVLVASSLGKTGPNTADINGDEVVDIRDLVKVAGALETAAAAPALHQQLLKTLTAADAQKWLSQAQDLDLTEATTQRGVRFLEQLLAVFIPKETVLLANYPNPFNPETWIPYQLAEPADVTLHIYAIDGKLIRALVLGHQPAGMYRSRTRAAYWDGRNQVGEPLASGVYFYTLTAGNFTATRKMLILK